MFLEISTLLSLALHVFVVLGISLRVIMRRPPSGTALAWMFLVAFLPLVGAMFYLLIGERRVGLRRARRIAALRSDYAKLAQQVIDRGLTQVAWDKHRPEARGMDRLGTSLVGIPTVAGSMAKFCPDSEEILRAIARDIDNAAEERADGILHLERRRGRRRGFRGPGSCWPAGRLLPGAGRCGRRAAVVERPATRTAP